MLLVSAATAAPPSPERESGNILGKEVITHYNTLAFLILDGTSRASSAEGSSGTSSRDASSSSDNANRSAW